MCACLNFQLYCFISFNMEIHPIPSSSLPSVFQTSNPKFLLTYLLSFLSILFFPSLHPTSFPFFLSSPPIHLALSPPYLLSFILLSLTRINQSFHIHYTFILYHCHPQPTPHQILINSKRPLQELLVHSL